MGATSTVLLWRFNYFLAECAFVFSDLCLSAACGARFAATVALLYRAKFLISMKFNHPNIAEEPLTLLMLSKGS